MLSGKWQPFGLRLNVLKHNSMISYRVWLWEVYAGNILCMCPANEKRCYSVTSSLIGWAHPQKDVYDIYMGLWTHEGHFILLFHRIVLQGFIET